MGNARAAVWTSRRVTRGASKNPSVGRRRQCLGRTGPGDLSPARRDSVTRKNEATIIAFATLDEAELHQHAVDHQFDAYFQKGQAPSRLATSVTLFAN